MCSPYPIKLKFRRNFKKKYYSETYWERVLEKIRKMFPPTVDKCHPDVNQWTTFDNFWGNPARYLVFAEPSGFDLSTQYVILLR